MLLCLTITLNFLMDEMNGKKTRIYQAQETKVPWTAESTSWKETKWNIAIQHNNATIKNMKGAMTMWSVDLTFFSSYSAMHGCTFDTPSTQGTEETKNKFLKELRRVPAEKLSHQRSQSPLFLAHQRSELRRLNIEVSFRGSEALIW